MPRWLREPTRFLPPLRKLIVLFTPWSDLAAELREENPSLTLRLPCVDELRIRLEEAASAHRVWVTTEEAPIDAAPGLTVMQARLGFRKAAVEKVAVEKAGVKKAGVKKAGVEKAGVEKVAVEKVAVEKAAVEKAAVEKAAVEKAAVEKAAVEREHFDYGAVRPVARENEQTIHPSRVLEDDPAEANVADVGGLEPWKDRLDSRLERAILRLILVVGKNQVAPRLQSDGGREQGVRNQRGCDGSVILTPSPADGVFWGVGRQSRRTGVEVVGSYARGGERGGRLFGGGLVEGLAGSRFAAGRIRLRRALAPKAPYR